MVKMNIFGKLKVEILDFFEKAEENVKNNEEIENNISILTSDLREKLISNAYSHSFQQVKILSKNFSSECVEKLMMKVRILQKKPKEAIFEVIFIKIHGFY